MADQLNTTDDDSGSGRRGPIIVPFVPPRVAPAGVLGEAADGARPSATDAKEPVAFRSERDASQLGSNGVGSNGAGSNGAGSINGGPFASAAVVVDTLPASLELPSDSSPDDDAPLQSSSDVISDTIRRWARPTTLDELKSRGIRKVRSVSMSRVGALLEKAVNRALIERTLESDRGEALSLSSTAREQFVRLSQVEISGQAAPAELEVTEEVPLHERASSTLDRLKRELEDRRKVVADREKQLTDGDLDKVEENRLGNQMRELFATHAGVDDRMLEREVLGLVFGELRTSRRRARLARLEEHQREIGVLERRVSKLSVLLGETEDALRKVRASKHTDPGLSSIYDEVQGLVSDDDQFEQKSDLMRSLFEANLALRQ